jgi:hypothetical protein
MSVLFCNEIGPKGQEGLWPCPSWLFTQANAPARSKLVIIYFKDRMKRGIHIVVGLLAVVLLVRPFDCFASGLRDREAMDCCLKGKCAPTAKSDDCCKNTVPGDSHLIPSQVPNHSAPAFAVACSSVSIPLPVLADQGSVASLRHPPPSSNLTLRNLPLLI